MGEDVKLRKLGPWDGDIEDPACRADLVKDINRVIRGALIRQLQNKYPLPKADAIGCSLSGAAADAVLELLWRGYVYE